MTTPDPSDAPTAVPQLEPDRADLIEALSWTEDMEHGRWGTEHAAAVLDAHDARVHAALAEQNKGLLAELEKVRVYAALSWPSDTEVGRWGTKYATAVLEAHDAQVHAALLAEVEELRAYAAIAHGPEAWASAMEEMLRLREEVAAVQKAAAVAEQELEVRVRSGIASALRLLADQAVDRRDAASTSSTGSQTSRDRIARHDGYGYGMRAAAVVAEKQQLPTEPPKEPEPGKTPTHRCM